MNGFPELYNVVPRTDWGPYYCAAAAQTFAWFAVMAYYVFSRHAPPPAMGTWLHFLTACNVVVGIFVTLCEKRNFVPARRRLTIP